MFSTFDGDGSGKIGEAELTRVLCALGYECGEHIITRAMADHAANFRLQFK